MDRGESTVAEFGRFYHKFKKWFSCMLEFSNPLISQFYILLSTLKTMKNRMFASFQKHHLALQIKILKSRYRRISS